MEANTGASALSAFAEHKPDLVVLDILLPGVSGAEVCLSLRRQSSVPITMLTSRTEEMDRVVGLEIGADDYVTKSLSTREMVARVKDHIRRSNKLSMPAGNRRLVCDDMVLDLDQHMFTVA